MTIKHIIILLMIISCFSCKNSNISTASSVVQNLAKKENAQKCLQDTITSCSLGNRTRITLLNSRENNKHIFIDVKGHNTDTKTNIHLDSLNFINHEISNVELECYQTSFVIKYTEQLGNNYYFTHHKFIFDETSGSFLFNKSFKTESTRNGLSISGGIIRDNTTLANYTGNETEGFEMKSIYSFYGFQEGKEPMIDSYYQSIKKLQSTNHKDIQLFGDNYVLNYISETVEMNTDNLSQYNDIAYYLEQSGLYEEAIYLLEKITNQHPDRTIAYINLGDAYWGLGNKGKAQQAYRTYVKQMKTNAIGAKIPEQVLERITE